MHKQKQRITTQTNGNGTQIPSPSLKGSLTSSLTSRKINLKELSLTILKGYLVLHILSLVKTNHSFPGRALNQKLM